MLLFFKEILMPILASCTMCSMASLAKRLCAVFSALSHKPSWTGKAPKISNYSNKYDTFALPYSDPSSTRHAFSME